MNVINQVAKINKFKVFEHKEVLGFGRFERQRKLESMACKVENHQ